MKNLVGIFFLLLLSFFDLLAMPAKTQNQNKETAAFDPAVAVNDYACIVQINPQNYVDLMAAPHNGATGKKWFFTASFFDGDKFVSQITFPASLNVPIKAFDDYKPIILGFIPRTIKSAAVGWEREMVTVEHGGLFKYLLWAKKERATGNPRVLVDFGRRIPLYIGKEKIDPLSVQVDSDGSVYFKTIKRDIFKWDADKEYVIPAVNMGLSIKPAKQEIEVTHTDKALMFSVADKPLVVPGQVKAQLMDPLFIDLDVLKKPYQNFGTEQNSLVLEDYKRMFDDEIFTPGQLMVLYNLLQKRQIIWAKPPFANDQQELLKKTIIRNYAAYQKNVNTLCGIKKNVREKMARPLPKKWLLKDEVNRMIIALSIGNPASGGVKTIYASRAIVPGRARPVSFTHHGKVGVWQGQFVVCWGLYRFLKQALRSGVIDDPTNWDVYTKETVELLKKVIREHGMLFMTRTPGKLQQVFNDFLKVSNQPSWKVWLEKENRKLDFELLFDYFSFLTLTDYMALFGQLKMLSSFEQFRMDSIIKEYKSSKLCAIS